MSPTLLAIDPGPVQSAWLLYADGQILTFGKSDNADLLGMSRRFFRPLDVDTVVIEKVEAMGMAVGAEVFETVWWSGQFAEATYPRPVERITRRQVKLHLCGNMRAKDPNIRQALIDRFGGTDAIGKKAKPGPLFGISKDVWSALAIAVTYADGVR